jgi:hypothetical protein
MDEEIEIDIIPSSRTNFTPIEWFYKFFPISSTDVFEELVKLDSTNKFDVSNSIFDFSNENDDYLLNDRNIQEGVLAVYENQLSILRLKLSIHIDDFIETNMDSGIYVAYHIQRFIETLKRTDEFDKVDFEEIDFEERHTEGIYEYWEVFEETPLFCSKIFRATRLFILSLAQEFSLKYSIYLTRIITREDIEQNEQLLKIDKAVVTERIVFLNELGVLEAIRTKYPKISDAKLAFIIRKICLPEHSVDTIKRHINCIENPPTQMSKKNNPYQSSKNLDSFETFIAKLKLPKS